MISDTLKELIHLALAPGDYDERKEMAIHRRAKMEGTSIDEVNAYVYQIRQELCNRVELKDVLFERSFFIKRVNINDSLFLANKIKCDGSRIVASRRKYLLFGKQIEKELVVRPILYFDVFQKIGIRKRVEFGTAFEQWNFRLKYKDAINLKMACEKGQAEFCDSTIIRASVTKKHSLTQPLLWVSNDHIVYSHNLLSKSEDHTIVKISDIRFFCTNRGKINTNVYFGYYDQIEIDGLKKEAVERLENHCKKNGARIGYPPLATYYPSKYSLSRLNPFNIFIKERIVLNDEAVIYYKTTLSRSECAYIEYDKIILFATSFGFFNKKIRIFGEQNFATAFDYSTNGCVNGLQKLLKEKGASLGHARFVYTRPYFTSLGANRIGITGTGLCLWSKEYFWGGKYSSKRKSFYISYDQIYHYERFRWCGSECE